MGTPIQTRKVIFTSDDGKEQIELERTVDGILWPKDTELGPVYNFVLDKQPRGWERLDAKTHAQIFPIDGLGQLPEGHAWYIQIK